MSSVLGTVLMVGLTLGLTSAIGVVTYTAHAPGNVDCDGAGQSGGFVRVRDCGSEVPPRCQGPVDREWRESVFMGVTSWERVWVCRAPVEVTEVTEIMAEPPVVADPVDCGPSHVAKNHYGKVFCVLKPVSTG